MKRIKKYCALITAAMLAVVLFAGCSRKASYDSAAYSANKTDSYRGAAPSAAKAEDYGYNLNYDAAMEDISYAEADVPGDYNNGSSGTTNVTPQDTGRKLIRRVQMNVESLEFDQSVKTIESYVTAFGGYIESSSISDSNYYYGYSYNTSSKARIASYVIRIPGDRLDGFLSQAGNIGNITSQSMSSEDITLSYLDLEARTESLEIQQERLLALLEKAETVEEIISLEDRLSTVRYQIESQRSQLKNYDNLVSYSTVTISLVEVLRITSPEPVTMGERISQGLSDTFYDLGEWFEDFAVGFVINLPYILIWAVIIAVVIFIIIRIVRASKKRSAKKQAELQAKLQADWAARQAAQNQNKQNEQ